MEGVEDIPGTALHEGIEWGRWTTFPEYIDYLETRTFTMDIGTQVPHSAVRNYVMGERALRHEDASAEDLEAICRIVADGLHAGALGFSTSRTIGHRSVSGEPIPGTFAEKEELLAIGRTLKAAGRGVFQAVPAGVVGDLAGPERWTTEQEVELFAEVARESGPQLHLYPRPERRPAGPVAQLPGYRGAGQRLRPDPSAPGARPPHRPGFQSPLLSHVSAGARPT